MFPIFPVCLSGYSYVCDINQESRLMLSSKTRSARAHHISPRREKIRQKKLSLICIIVFMMLLVRAEGGLKKERGGARGQLLSFPFDLVGMGMNTTSLMNLQIQIEKTSEGGLVEVGVKIEQFCLGLCPFFEAGCSRLAREIYVMDVQGKEF